MHRAPLLSMGAPLTRATWAVLRRNKCSCVRVKGNTAMQICICMARCQVLPDILCTVGPKAIVPHGNSWQQMLCLTCVSAFGSKTQQPSTRANTAPCGTWQKQDILQVGDVIRIGLCLREAVQHDSTFRNDTGRPARNVEITEACLFGVRGPTEHIGKVPAPLRPYI